MLEDELIELLQKIEIDPKKWRVPGVSKIEELQHVMGESLHLDPNFDSLERVFPGITLSQIFLLDKYSKEILEKRRKSEEDKNILRFGRFRDTIKVLDLSEFSLKSDELSFIHDLLKLLPSCKYVDLKYNKIDSFDPIISLLEKNRDIVVDITVNPIVDAKNIEEMTKMFKRFPERLVWFPEFYLGIGNGSSYKAMTIGAKEVADLMFDFHQRYYREISKFSGYS